MEEVPEVAAEPLTDRGLEAALAPADDCGGEHVPERLAKNALAAQCADLPPTRNPEGVFDDPMIQERNANLEGVGHARHVDLGEHVSREPEPAVRVEHPVDPLAVVDRGEAQGFGREQVGGGAARGDVRDQRAHLGFPAHLRPACVPPPRVGDAAAVGQPPELPDGLLEAIPSTGRRDRRRPAEQPDERTWSPRGVRLAQVLPVAREELVGPVAGEHHLDVPARLAGYLERRHERGVGKGLVEVVEGRRHRREDLGPRQGNLGVDAADPSRHLPAEARLVEDRILGEGDREGA